RGLTPPPASSPPIRRVRWDSRRLCGCSFRTPIHAFPQASERAVADNANVLVRQTQSPCNSPAALLFVERHDEAAALALAQPAEAFRQPAGIERWLRK